MYHATALTDIEKIVETVTWQIFKNKLDACLLPPKIDRFYSNKIKFLYKKIHNF